MEKDKCNYSCHIRNDKGPSWDLCQVESFIPMMLVVCDGEETSKARIDVNCPALSFLLSVLLTRDDHHLHIAMSSSPGNPSLPDTYTIFKQIKIQKDNIGFINANFKDAPLAGMDFSGQDLTGANFSGADLRNASFANANLTDVNFVAADLRGANMSGAILKNTKFANREERLLP